MGQSGHRHEATLTWVHRPPTPAQARIPTFALPGAANWPAAVCQIIQKKFGQIIPKLIIGAVEGACKHLVSARFKQAGMRWKGRRESPCSSCARRVDEPGRGPPRLRLLKRTAARLRESHPRQLLQALQPAVV